MELPTVVGVPSVREDRKGTQTSIISGENNPKINNHTHVGSDELDLNVLKSHFALIN